MNFKKYIKRIVLIGLVPVISTYLMLVFLLGGFGKKSLAFKDSIGEEDPVLFFAHRGASAYYPENSLKGIEESKKRGFHATEVDIMKSSDNDFIVFNDENISTVKELLNNEKHNRLFYFDMKLSSFKDADRITKIVNDQKRARSVIVASSDIFFVFYMEYHYPEIVTALEGFNSGKEWTYYLMPKDLRPDFISSFAINADQDHIEWLKRNELMDRQIVYGVDTRNINLVLKEGFKNIIIDYDSSFTESAPANLYFTGD